MGTKKIRMVDLFSGIGGFRLAAEWVWPGRVECVGHSEIEPYPCKVYHRHFPESECLGDITKIDWTEERFRNIDLLTGGFPCQPHSVAGKRKASEDERDLWGECLRAISILRPRYALFENVPGLLVSERGRFFNRVISDLAQAGFDVEWDTVGAWQVGAHHKRDRIWIVAYPMRLRYEGNMGAAFGQGREEASDTEPRSGSASGNAVLGTGEAEDVAHASVQGLQGWSHDCTKPSGEPRGSQSAERGGASGELRHPSIPGLPDWSGGEMGQPWPVTEFERPGGEDVSNTNSGGCSPIIDSGSGTEEVGGREGDVESVDSGRHKEREVERVFCRVVTRLPNGMDDGGMNGTSEKERAEEILRLLRKGSGAQEIQREVGGLLGISPAQVLWAQLHDDGDGKGECDNGSVSQESGEGEGTGSVRGVRNNRETPPASCGQEYQEQFTGEPCGVVRLASPETPLENGTPGTLTVYLAVSQRVARLKGLGNAIVPQVAAVILERIKVHMG